MILTRLPQYLLVSTTACIAVSFALAASSVLASGLLTLAIGEHLKYPSLYRWRTVRRFPLKGVIATWVFLISAPVVLLAITGLVSALAFGIASLLPLVPEGGFALPFIMLLSSAVLSMALLWRKRHQTMHGIDRYSLGVSRGNWPRNIETISQRLAFSFATDWLLENLMWAAFLPTIYPFGSLRAMSESTQPETSVPVGVVGQGALEFFAALFVNIICVRLMFRWWRSLSPETRAIELLWRMVNGELSVSTKSLTDPMGAKRAGLISVARELNRCSVRIDTGLPENETSALSVLFRAASSYLYKYTASLESLSVKLSPSVESTLRWALVFLLDVPPARFYVEMAKTWSAFGADGTPLFPRERVRFARMRKIGTHVGRGVEPAGRAILIFVQVGVIIAVLVLVALGRINGLRVIKLLMGQ